MSSTPATSATSAGRTARRGRNTPGLDRPQAADGVAALAPDEARLGRAELEALADDDRLVVVLGGRAGRRRHRLGERERRRQRVARPAFGVQREGGLADRGTGADDQHQQDQEPDDRHRGGELRRPLERARRASRSRATTSATATPASTYQARRTERRSHSRRRWRDEAGPQRRSAPDRAATPSVAGIGGDDRGGGRDRGRCARARGPRGRPRHQVISSIGGAGAPSAGARRIRQRRVGATIWTDRITSTTAATSIAATERGQNVSWSIAEPLVADVAVDHGVEVGHRRDDLAGAAEPRLGAADHVELGDERVEVQQRLGRPPREGRDRASRRACAAWLGRNPLAVIDDQNTNRNVAPAVSTIVSHEVDDRRRLGPLHERRHEQAHRAERDRGREQDDVGRGRGPRGRRRRR